MIDVTKLSQFGKIKKYKPDQTFFCQGDPGHEMFIILQGRVGVFVNSYSGFSSITEYGPGDFFGEMSMIQKLPRSETIHALEATIAMEINADSFQKIIAEEPRIAQKIVKRINNRLKLQEIETIGVAKVAEAKQEITSGQEESIINDNEGMTRDAASSAQQTTNVELFPPGHKGYPTISISTDNEYLFEKEAVCAVCEQKFSVKRVRSSKLRLQSVDADLRQRFTDFEPLWYLVWVCPHCYYANFYSDFKKVTVAVKKLLLEHSKQLKSQLSLEIKEPLQIDHVFLNYYLALQTQKAGEQDPEKIARIWLRLAWLYDDVDDKEMMVMASKQAYENYKDAYYNKDCSRSVDQEQRLSLVMGELSLRIGETFEAAKHFRLAINHRLGNVNINRQAEDRIQE
ncbi:MAG: DUF2225 domain-containing protein [Syntrophomonadaceae bacterium]|nr:DUF2225 domain-containing protein [Syntrophomonadaceae bacterium]